ncbi:hypothetical protein PCE1_001554 [Barthelona sp. PCE]
MDLQDHFAKGDYERVLKALEASLNEPNVSNENNIRHNIALCMLNLKQISPEQCFTSINRIQPSTFVHRAIYSYNKALIYFEAHSFECTATLCQDLLLYSDLLPSYVNYHVLSLLVETYFIIGCFDKLEILLRFMKKMSMNEDENNFFETYLPLFYTKFYIMTDQLDEAAKYIDDLAPGSLSQCLLAFYHFKRLDMSEAFSVLHQYSVSIKKKKNMSRWFTYDILKSIYLNNISLICFIGRQNGHVSNDRDNKPVSALLGITEALHQLNKNSFYYKFIQLNAAYILLYLPVGARTIESYHRAYHLFKAAFISSRHNSPRILFSAGESAHLFALIMSSRTDKKTNSKVFGVLDVVKEYIGEGPGRIIRLPNSEETIMHGIRPSIFSLDGVDKLKDWPTLEDAERLFFRTIRLCVGAAQFSLSSMYQSIHMHSRVHLAHCCLKKLNPIAALRNLQDVSKDPQANASCVNSLWFSCLLSECYLRMRTYDRARAELKKTEPTTDANPLDEVTRAINIAYTYIAQNNFSEAMKYAEIAKSRQSHSPSPILIQVFILLKQGRVNNAISIIKNRNFNANVGK